MGLQAALGWARSTSLTASLQMHLTPGAGSGQRPGVLRGQARGQQRRRVRPGLPGQQRQRPSGCGRAPAGRRGPSRWGAPATPAPLGDRAPLFVTDLYPTEEVSLTLATDAMDDPFLRPAQPGVRILPRPGKVARLDFPMVVSGEITGIAQMVGPKGARDLAGLALELLDEQGRRVVAVRSSFDGFFDMKDLPPGRYQLRALPEEAQRLAVSLPAPRYLDIQARGSIHEGIMMKVASLEGGTDAASTLAAARAMPAPQAPAPAIVSKLTSLASASTSAAGAAAAKLPAVAPAPQPPAPAIVPNPTRLASASMPAAGLPVAAPVPQPSATAPLPQSPTLASTPDVRHRRAPCGRAGPGIRPQGMDPPGGRVLPGHPPRGRGARPARPDQEPVGGARPGPRPRAGLPPAGGALPQPRRCRPGHPAPPPAIPAAGPERLSHSNES